MAKKKDRTLLYSGIIAVSFAGIVLLLRKPKPKAGDPCNPLEDSPSGFGCFLDNTSKTGSSLRKLE